MDLKVEIIWQLNVIVWLGKTGQGGFGYKICQYLFEYEIINIGANRGVVLGCEMMKTKYKRGKGVSGERW